MWMMDGGVGMSPTKRNGSFTITPRREQKSAGSLDTRWMSAYFESANMPAASDQYTGASARSRRYTEWRSPR